VTRAKVHRSGWVRAAQARAGSKLRSRGIGLLETIAALTIMASGAIILFSWIVQTQATLVRVEQEAQKNTAKLVALGFLDTLNPSVQPRGRQDFAQFGLQWQADLVQPARNTLGLGGQAALFDAGLYTVRVQVNRPGGVSWFDFEQLLVGYKQVREFDPATGFR
jgi:general secretion pathway protein I